MKQGIRPTVQDEFEWAKHLTKEEQDFLQALGGFIHVLGEPASVGKYKVVVVDNDQKKKGSAKSCIRYCFLNGPPWVYCCEAG